MSKPQFRIAKEVVAAALSERAELGFSMDESVNAVMSVLAREGLEARRARARRAHRVALYAEWAGEPDLSEGVRETARMAIDGGVA